MDDISINRFEWLKATTQAEDLLPAAKVIGTALAVQFANDVTGQTNPSVPTLCDYVKLSPATVKRAIKALVEAGWLRKTEGRGRGNVTEYTLCSPGKIVPFSHQKTGVTGEPLTKEKGSRVNGKGVMNEPFHYKDKQSLEQRARTSGEKPSPHLQTVVHRGSHHEIAWSEWLALHGYPTLPEIGERYSDANGPGWSMPFSLPPAEGEETANRIAEKRVWWLINRSNQRAGSEVRYAAE